MWKLKKVMPAISWKICNKKTKLYFILTIMRHWKCCEENEHKSLYDIVSPCNNKGIFILRLVVFYVNSGAVVRVQCAENEKKVR